MTTKHTGSPAPWTFAGLMLSYWCNARCKFCYINAGPEHTTWADPHQVVQWYSGLQELARQFGKDVKIHITGGEPFGNFPVLLEVLQLARQADLPPIQKIETNAYWATDQHIATSRLEQIKSLGVQKITVSCDIFHQQHVPIQNVRNLVDAARQVMGPNGLIVRWWDFFNQHDPQAANDPGTLDDQQLAQSLANGRDRLTGRAALLACDRLQGKMPQEFKNHNCRKAILSARHVHIDPHSNIFPGTCSGLIVGSATVESPKQIWHWIDTHGLGGPVFDALISAGPYGLYELALRHGYQANPAGYLQPCQLCFHLRRFLFNRGLFGKWLGPAQCYPAESEKSTENDRKKLPS